MNTWRLVSIPFLILALALSLLAAPPESIPAPPDVAAPPADAQVTASGLASKVLAPGTGTEHPVATDLQGVRLRRVLPSAVHDATELRGLSIVLPIILHRCANPRRRPIPRTAFIKAAPSPGGSSRRTA